MKESKSEYIKRRTIELYDSLPQDMEERKKRIDIRDQVLELNYTFFGYVASHTYINNTSVTYEDKFQSCLLHFLECWWWYKYAAKYRTDLSFAVFFKPRLGEMIERELNEVKYSVRRSLCMEAGKQLGKHWAQVKYDDLSKVSLPVDKLNALKSIFGTMYWADLGVHSLYIKAPNHACDPEEYYSDKYNTITELLIHEMVNEECKLDDKHLLKMSEIYDIPFNELKDKLPEAELQLYEKLKLNQEIYDNFN